MAGGAGTLQKNCSEAEPTVRNNKETGGKRVARGVVRARSRQRRQLCAAARAAQRCRHACCAALAAVGGMRPQRGKSVRCKQPRVRCNVPRTARTVHGDAANAYGMRAGCSAWCRVRKGVRCVAEPGGGM